MLADRDGNLWIGFAEHGIARLTNGSVELYGTAQGLPGSAIMNALYEDSEGSLWIGLFEAGLVQLQGGRFKVFGKPEGLAADSVWSVGGTPSGSVWAGTDHAVDHLVNGKVTESIDLDTTSKARLHTLFVQSDGTVWVGLAHGVLGRIKDGRTTT